ncbi:hypothetical protein [Kocuria sp. U4B]
MSSQQSLDDHDRTRTAPVPVRVFDDVADTPWTPAPRWWNHPMTVAVTATLCACVLTVVPSLPPMTGFLVALTGYVAALGLAISRWWWSTSRDRAGAEAAWVAGQSGYALSVAEGALRWTDEDGTKSARLDHHRGGWRLSLYDVHAPALQHGA